MASMRSEITLRTLKTLPMPPAAEQGEDFVVTDGLADVEWLRGHTGQVTRILQRGGKSHLSTGKKIFNTGDTEEHRVRLEERGDSSPP